MIKLLLMTDGSVLPDCVLDPLNSHRWNFAVMHYDSINIDAIIKQDYDIALLVCGGSIWHVYTHIRNFKCYTAMPCIALLEETANDDYYRVVDALNVDGFLVKPVAPQMLELYCLAILNVFKQTIMKI